MDNLIPQSDSLLRQQLLSVTLIGQITRVIPKVMSNFFLRANWEQQAKESAVVDGTNCCVILECLCDVSSLHHVTSITPNKMADNNMSFRSMLSSNSL